MLSHCQEIKQITTDRVVEYNEVSAYAEENGLFSMETSAKTAFNVSNIFLAIAKKLPKKGEVVSESIKLMQGTKNDRKKLASCCNK